MGLCENADLNHLKRIPTRNLYCLKFCMAFSILNFSRYVEKFSPVNFLYFLTGVFYKWAANKTSIKPI